MLIEVRTASSLPPKPGESLCRDRNRESNHECPQQCLRSHYSLSEQPNWGSWPSPIVTNTITLS